MAIDFESVLVAGVTLIRDAIQSSNFVSEVSGWTIRQDGSYEFGFGGVFRGELIVTDPDGSMIRVTTVGSVASIDLQPPDSANPGVVFSPGKIFASSDNMGSQNFAQLIIKAPDIQLPVFHGSPTIVLTVESVDGDTTIALNAGEVFARGIMRVGPDDADIGRGRVAYAGATGNSAAILNVNTSVLTTASTLFRAGRAYEVRLAGKLATSAVNMSPSCQIVSSAPTTLYTYGRLSNLLAGQYAIPNPEAVFTVGATNVTRTISLQINSNDGANNVVHAGPRWMSIFDIGPATGYPDAVVLV